MKKGLIIGIIAGCALVVIAIAVGVGIAASGGPALGPNGQPVEPNVRQSLPPVAGAGRLLRLYNSQTRPAGGNRVVARSYDGNPWEIVSDLDYPPAEIDCTTGECALLAPGTTYVEELSVPASLTTPTAAERMARLGFQATFGLNRADLMATATQYTGNVAKWVRDQMALPATLLRTYYRERTNPRQAAGSFVGAVTRPCEVGARYHRFAINNDDLKTQLDVTVNDAGINAYVLRINGVMRGEVTTFLGNTYPNMTGLANAYTICTIQESVGGEVEISANLGSCSSRDKVDWVNPAIAMTNPEKTQTLSRAQATFTAVDGKPDSLILTALNVACGNQGVGTDSFFRYDGTFLRFDPRLKLVDNTLDDPASVQASAGNGVCPAVPRTFLNAATCVRRTSCSPLEFSSAPVILNDETLRAWYTLSGRYVYYMRGLALTSPYDKSPCDDGYNSGISRWLKLNDGNCASPTNLDATTRTTISTALANSDDTNTLIRDITLTGEDCTESAASIGAKVTAGGACWQHVHPNEYDVRDMSYWVLFHDGNDDAADAGKPNPISRWAISGLTNLDFPVHNHPMSRWKDRQSRLPLIGRYGDTVDFRSLTTELQTEPMAQRAGAVQQAATDGFEACGAPGEVANKPQLGHRYLFPDPSDDDVERAELDWRHDSNHGKQIVWTNVVMTAADQLRQRTAWALSQILTISFQGIGDENLISPWVSYYDIFVRHAFGNYRDILKEVSYHPMMGIYLSYRDNRAFDKAKTYPDENYAREIMQLFSIGLWKLNDDGTRVTDETGEPIATYTNDDIVDFARVWTGFDRQQQRGNIEARDGITGANKQDPMQIKVNNRDYLPKAKLDAGYLGDHYPLCEELPPQHWVRKGAVWKFTGAKSIEGATMDAEGPTTSGPKGRFAPSPATSALYQKLCAPVNNRCTFPSEVVLDENLLCDGQECAAGSVISAKIVDAAAGVTNYYTYQSVPCVRLTYFPEGEGIRHGGWKQCTNKHAALGSILCCEVDRPTRRASYINSTQCTFANEKVNFETAKARCAAEGYGLCSKTYGGGADWATACSDDAFYWYDGGNCTLKVQVLASGLVELVDVDNTRFNILKESSGSSFRVRWQDGFPVAAAGCGPSCEVVAAPGGSTCVCSADVHETVVFTDSSYVPTPDEARAALSVGAPDPSSFDANTYTLCTTGACVGRTDVKVWTKAGSPNWNRETIFEVEPYRAGGRRMFLFNYESRVHVDSHSFRNPPHWLPLAGEQLNSYREWHSTAFWTHRAHQEVDDLLDHLFEHPTTAPFVAYRMIQRMVTSNPSPRYMKAVVDAFRTGTYKGEVFSGKYGDMGATIMAVLMDREARNVIVEADPSFGLLREPLLKVIHMMRALEFKTKDTREIMFPGIRDKIGQEPLSAPSVFGFYLPEHRPAGPVADNGLVSPEAEIATAPLIVSYMNGMSSLIDNGLTACDGGFGYNYQRSCSGTRKRTTADGAFGYTVANTTAPSVVVQDLNLLLTAGRLDPTIRDRIVQEFAAEREAKGHESAMRRVLKLLVATPEFHTTNANVKSTEKRVAIPQVEGQGRRYKAIVVIFESGGSDSFNKIVPHSGCGSNDLYAEYANVRSGASVGKNQLLTVQMNGQPCSTFGIHPSTPVLKQLYDDDQAAFLMNIGALVEPMTKEEYKKKLKRRPPSLFSHNTMQRSMHNLHAQNAAAKGILGRIITAMEGWKSELYSLTGNIKMLEGSRAPDIINRYSGVVRYNQYGSLKEAINNFTEFQSRSLFSETFADLMQNSLDKAEAIGELLASTQLNATFGNDGFSRQLRQVSRLIKMRKELNTERAVFVTNRGGFDTHNTFDLDSRFGEIDGALAPFVEELKIQGVWNDVVILTVSDFARTLTSNGAGTDHAWGGMHWVAGGGVRGGQAFGTYPDSLKEDGDLNLGRGRVLPTLPWEAPWRAIAEWFGVPAGEMETVLPNMNNFPNTISRNQMFR